MKRLYIYGSLLCTLLLSSCQSEMDDRHKNPDGFTEGKMEYLYSRGLVRTIENDYGDYWSHVFRLLGTYTQTTARKSGESRNNVYRIENDKGRWDNYYMKRMQELVEMEKIYNFVLTDQKEKDSYEPYIQTGKVLKAYNTANASDFFGDMPYSEAWMARNGIFGQPIILTPKYDKQKQIYYMVLNDLMSAAKYLKDATLDANIEKQQLFKTQDAMYKGDLKKWYKFTNSLLLRYAMRISYIDPAKTKEVLATLSPEQMIIDNADNAYTFLTQKTTAKDNGIWRAMRESQNKDAQMGYAPENMVKILTAANDPRLPVLFQPGSDKDGVAFDEMATIVGYPESADDAKTIVATLTADQIKEKYGINNTVTYRNNFNLPYGVGMTASDVYALLAEARVRELIATGNAKEYYEKAIILSVQEYYNYYKNSTEKALMLDIIATADVSDATLTTWINNSTFKYNTANAEELIATQRWINMGILQPFESWTELRRTHLPKMVRDVDSGILLNLENAPVRFLYPSTESTLNPINFENVADQNYSNKKLWWDAK